MPEFSVLYSIALLFWLDWLINIRVAAIAAFMVRGRPLLKVLVISIFYIATPWLFFGMPTTRGQGLVDLLVFTAGYVLYESRLQQSAQLQRG